MKTRPLAFALLLALAPAATFPPRVAFAQAADDATTKMARQRFQEGVAYFDKGQFEMARGAFLQAYALRKHPVVLLNLAQSSLKSGHSLEASRYFQEFLKEYGSATEVQRADATKGLAEARTRLGRIDVVGATTGADVYIDDERIGMAPLDHSVDVEPGSHSVRLQGGGADQSQQVIATAGQPTTARFSSAAAAPTPTPAPAESPPAEPSPSPAPEPAPAAAPAPGPAPAEESQGSHHWGWVIASGIVTVAGFAIAGVMASEKSSAQSSADTEADAIVNYAAGQKPPQNPQGVCYNPAGTTYAAPCSALASDNNNVNADATIANVGIAIGVVGLVGLTISVIGTAMSYGGSSADAKPAAAPASAFTVTPIFGKGLGGVGFGGTF